MPPVIGMLILLGSLGLLAVGVGAVIVGGFAQRPSIARGGSILAGLSIVGYATAWLGGMALTPKRLLPIGEEISFCGLDCHLHVSVSRVTRAGDLAVVLRFRSNAKAANEYPGDLRFQVVDSDGRRYLPSSGIIAEPLPAGATIEREFRFSVPDGVSRPRLLISYGGWLDYLVPGEANPRVRRKTGLAL